MLLVLSRTAFAQPLLQTAKTGSTLVKQGQDPVLLDFDDVLVQTIDRKLPAMDTKGVFGRQRKSGSLVPKRGEIQKEMTTDLRSLGGSL